MAHLEQPIATYSYSAIYTANFTTLDIIYAEINVFVQTNMAQLTW